MKVTSIAGATDWLVSRASGVLDRTLTRRSFVSKATMVGTAVAATGCAVVTQPGSPYTYITDCGGGSLCRDGYTEFCCVINKGVNACPPGSIASGWWRADYSVFCNGTRYYIDCNEFPDGGPCRCADGCGTRKVYCNHFRYGQCAPFIGGTGVIACRMVTCVPPYTIPELACSPSGAVDNATAGHNANCAAYAPPPLVDAPVVATVGSAAVPAPGAVVVVVRGSNGALWHRDFDGSSWSAAWESLGGTASGTPSLVASPGDRLDLVVRAGDKSVAWQSRQGGVWSAWQSLGGVATSDAVIGFDGTGYEMVTRGTNNRLATKRLVGTTWSGWVDLGGLATSNPALASDAARSSFAVRGAEGNIAVNAYEGGWAGWTDLGGRGTSDPAIALTPGGRHVFVRGEGAGAYARQNVGSGWTAWIALGGSIASDLVATADGAAVSVFGRGGDGTLYHQRWEGGSWGGWESLGIFAKCNPTAVSDGTNLWVFLQGSDDTVWWLRRTAGTWSAPESLTGLTVAPVRGTT